MSTIKLKKTMLRHIKIKLLKSVIFFKKGVKAASNGKNNYVERNKIQVRALFKSEMMKARRK